MQKLKFDYSQDLIRKIKKEAYKDGQINILRRISEAIDKGYDLQILQRVVDKEKRILQQGR